MHLSDSYSNCYFTGIPLPQMFKGKEYGILIYSHDEDWRLDYEEMVIKFYQDWKPEYDQYTNEVLGGYTETPFNMPMLYGKDRCDKNNSIAF